MPPDFFCVLYYIVVIFFALFRMTNSVELLIDDRLPKSEVR